MARIHLDDRVMRLVRDAQEWRLLGRVLECPSDSWREDVARLGRDLGDEAFRTLAATAVSQASEGLYHSAFGPGGPAPPREASYLASVELGSLLSAIEGDYAAFAYHPDADEPADHIAVEAGFIAYLRLKEAFAVAVGDEEASAITARVAARFLADHIAPVAHPLADLLNQSGIEYLAQSARLIAVRSGPRPATRQLPVIQRADSPDDDRGSEFACDVD